MDRWTPWVRWGACVFVAVSILYFLSLNPGVEQDDALIYLRYVRNVQSGQGLVFNEGELVNGLTSPLYTYLLLTFSPFFEDLHRLPIWISGACLVLSVWVLMDLCLLMTNRAFSMVSGLLMACSPYFYCFLGMETSLFVLLLVASLWAFQRHKHDVLYILCALLLLARPEGVFLVAAMGVEFIRQRRPMPKVKQLVWPGVILIAHGLFSTVYYGSPFSQSGSAKLLHGMSGFWGKWPKAFFLVQDHLAWYFQGKEWLLGLEFILAFIGVFSLSLRGPTAVILLFLCLYTAFYVLLNIANHPWYYAPYYFFGFLYIGAGMAQLYQKLPSLILKAFGADRSRTAQVVSGLMMVVLMLFLSWQNFQGTRKVARGSQSHSAYRKLGLWLKENTDPKTTVAAVEIGTLGWYSERPIIDVLGLVSPPNAKYIAKRDVHSWLIHYHPDVMVSHDPPWGIEGGIVEQVKVGEFSEEKRFTHPGYKLYVRKGGTSEWSGRDGIDGVAREDRSLGQAPGRPSEDVGAALPDPATLPFIKETRSIKLDSLTCAGKPFMSPGGNCVDVNDGSESSLVVVGYAIDPETHRCVQGVFICFDDHIHITAKYGMPRGDVVKALQREECLLCGFKACVDLSMLKEGQHELSIKAVSSDKTGYYLRRLQTPLVIR